MYILTEIRDNEVQNQFIFSAKDKDIAEKTFTELIMESDVYIEDSKHLSNIIEDGVCDIPNGQVVLNYLPYELII